MYPIWNFALDTLAFFGAAIIFVAAVQAAILALAVMT